MVFASNLTIFIVGKSDPQSASINAIRSAGYKVGILHDDKITLKNQHLFDYIEKVNFDILDEEIERLGERKLNIAGLICTYENYVVAKAKIGEYFSLPTLSAESAELSTDKSLMRRAFLNVDHSISPQYATIETLHQALEFANTFHYPLVLKPTSLVKSLLVLKCDSEQQLKNNFTYASATISTLYEKYHVHASKPQLIIEEFMTGPQYTVAAFIDKNGDPHFCEGTVKITTAQDIGVNDNYLYSRKLPATIPKNIKQDILRVSEIGVRALKMRSTPAHIELIHSTTGVKIIEIGARIGGYRPRMYDMSYGVALAHQEVTIATGKTPTTSGSFRSYSAVYELFPESEGTFQDIEGDTLSSQFTYFKVTVTKGDDIGPAKNGYKAAAIIIVSSADKKQFEILCSAAEAMKVRVET